MRLTSNQITANGTYSVPTLTGARYVLSVSGGFGGGSLAVKWAAPDGSLTAYASSPATAGTSWSFTAASEELDFVLTGATSPTLTVSVAPENLTDGGGGGGSIAGLTITFGKTLTVSNSLTLAGVDGASLYLGGIFQTSGSFYINGFFQTNGSFLTAGPVSFSGSDTVTFASPSTGGNKTYTFPTTSATLARTDAGQIFAGPQEFSSPTRPTSSGTGAPAAISLLTRDDAMLLFGGRDLWPYCTISASTNATASRSNNLVLTYDGNVASGAVTGNNLTVQFASQYATLDNFYTPFSVLASDKPWTVYCAISAYAASNTEIVMAVGALASAGVPTSGISCGFRISSGMLASVWRRTSGGLSESATNSIASSCSSGGNPSGKVHLWLRNTAGGSLSLYAVVTALRAAKPDFATASLIGTVTGNVTTDGTGISLSQRATGTTAAISYLYFYAASFTEI